MTTSLAVLLFASSLVPPSTASLVPAMQANSVNSLGAPGCGPADVQFDVKTEGKQQAAPVSEAGRALETVAKPDASTENKALSGTKLRFCNGF
jgi:hypothetical protein